MKRIACIGIVSLIGLLAVGCGEIVKGIQKAGAAGDAKIQVLLNALANGQAQDFYDNHTTTSFQAAVSEQQWEREAQKYQLYGQPVSWNRTNTSFNTTNNVTTGKVSYNVTWADGDGTVTLDLLETGNGWKVEQVNITADFSMKRVDSLTEDALSAIAAKQSKRFYDELASPRFRDSVTEQQWQEVMTTLARFGDVKSMKLTDRELFNNDGKVSGNFTYEVTWENVTGPAVISAERNDNTWEVLGVDANKALQKLNSR